MVGEDGQHIRLVEVGDARGVARLAKEFRLVIDVAVPRMKGLEATPGACSSFSLASTPAATKGAGLIRHEEEAAVVRRIFEPAARGDTNSAIARTLEAEGLVRRKGDVEEESHEG